MIASDNVHFSSGEEHCQIILATNGETPFRPARRPDRAAFGLLTAVSLVIHCALFMAVQGETIKNDVIERVITVDLKIAAPADEAKTGVRKVPQRMINHPSTIKLSSDDTVPSNNQPSALLRNHLTRLAESRPLPASSIVRQAVASATPELDRSVFSAGPESIQGTAIVPKVNSFQHQSDQLVSSGSAQDGHFAYLAQIKSLLDKKKEYPAMARRVGLEGTVLVRFNLGREGILRRAEISGSSGKSLLDQAALRFIKSTGRFPPLPESIKGNGITLEVPIIYKLANADS